MVWRDDPCTRRERAKTGFVNGCYGGVTNSLRRDEIKTHQLPLPAKVHLSLRHDRRGPGGGGQIRFEGRELFVFLRVRFQQFDLAAFAQGDDRVVHFGEGVPAGSLFGPFDRTGREFDAAKVCVGRVPAATGIYVPVVEDWCAPVGHQGDFVPIPPLVRPDFRQRRAVPAEAARAVLVRFGDEDFVARDDRVRGVDAFEDAGPPRVAEK